MGLAELTSADAVRQAIDEFDQLGREAFLAKYGFGPAKSYFLQIDGRFYDSKAIAGVAHGFQRPDLGPLSSAAFSAGESTVKRKLEALGFVVVDRDRAPEARKGIRFSRADCELFTHYEAGDVPLQEVPPSHKEHLRELRKNLKGLAEDVAAEISGTVSYSADASQWNVHGRVPPDLWCCVYPTSAGSKAYALQIAFIVSPRGGEICFCLGSGTGQGERKTEWVRLFGNVKRRLGEVPPEIVSAAEAELVSDWAFRRSWRLDAGAGEFASLEEWLEFASTPKGNRAAISRYLTPDELEARGVRVLDDLVELGKTVTPLVEFAYAGEVGSPEELIPPAEALEPAAASSSYDFDWLLETTLWPASDLEAVIETLAGPAPHVVLAGPPGTGKTWLAKRLITYLTQDRPDCHRVVQFHPSYSYEDFIEGLRPTSDEDGISFERVDGTVLDIVKSIGTRETPYYLLIDEMNRANLSRVFGELMYLFEYRDEAMSLRYTKDFKLPRTLRVIGTMNTADRSIRSIDIALRRRFEVFECPPSRAILERFYASEGYLNAVPSLVEGFEKLNQELRERIDRHHAVGHTFFMATTMDVARLDGIWSRKVRPLLEEYFFDQPELVTSVFAPEQFWPELAAS